MPPPQDLKNVFDLTGTVALITGGSKGVGRMIADGFLSYGAKVYIAARDLSLCERTARELSAEGRACIALQADVASVAGVKRLAEELRGREPALNILVNNAGAASIRDFSEFTEDDWDRVMDLNLKTPFFLTQALLEMLSAGASGGRPAKVINISSADGIGLNARPTFSYGASKAGLIHLTRQMAAALIGQNIVVSCIAPGPFVSDMNVAARQGAASGQARSGQTHRNRLGHGGHGDISCVARRRLCGRRHDHRRWRFRLCDAKPRPPARIVSHIFAASCSTSTTVIAASKKR